ncbi:MAG: carboxypeptidase-like regulatory domain-containing protein, partial [Aeriscardovia sp.]|nr:carboxypeptidase-like regulatory domain-containing protein [Aeriscardovia sp.]
MKRLILFSLICLVAIASTAQGISGRVIDEQAQPMPFANVVLVNRADSAFIAGAVTKDDGTFSISIDKQEGLLKVTSVGYTTKFLDARQGNVGDIQMQPDTQTLGEVVVKGERPQYKMTTGGMTVDIQNSLLKDVGTADDVLSMLPQIQGSDGNF